MKKAFTVWLGILIGSALTVALLDKSLSVNIRHEIVLQQVRK